MNFDQYKGRQIEIKSTGDLAVVEHIRIRHGQSGVMSARFVVHVNEKEIELCPHEVNFQPE